MTARALYTKPQKTEVSENERLPTVSFGHFFTNSMKIRGKAN